MTEDAPTSKYCGEFKLSVTEALRTQLIARLESLEWVPLHPENIAPLSNRGGVYQLAADGTPVYVGKSKATLADRLLQHYRKLSGRHKEVPPDPTDLRRVVDRMTFRCVYVDEDLDAVAPEKMLMSVLGSEGQADWNYMGFGNKDPGRNRDRSTVKSGHFDRIYPIDLDISVTIEVPQSLPLRVLMTTVKKALPFTFRFAEKPAALPTVEVPTGSLTARGWLEFIADELPAGWVIVTLPGYVIAYPELNPEDFPSRTGTWVANGGSSVFATHDPAFKDGEISSHDEEGDESA